MNGSQPCLGVGEAVDRHVGTGVCGELSALERHHAGPSVRSFLSGGWWVMMSERRSFARSRGYTGAPAGEHVLRDWLSKFDLDWSGCGPAISRRNRATGNAPPNQGPDRLAATRLCFDRVRHAAEAAG